MYCSKCGTSFEGGICPSCGAPSNPVPPPYQQPPQYQPPPAQQAPQPQMGGCPKCNSGNVHVTTETSGSTNGFGAGKGCLGALIFGPFGWLCGLCGMGKSKTSSNTFRVCGNCGNRFK